MGKQTKALISWVSGTLTRRGGGKEYEKIAEVINGSSLTGNGSSLTFVKPIWNPVENDAVLAAAGDPHEALGPLNVGHVVNVVSVNDDEGVSAAGDPLGELEAVSLLRGVDL